jgi:PLP dependent protein
MTELSNTTIANNLRLLQTQIAALDQGVCIVAVSKLKPLEAILAARAAGQRHFGENYVQEGIGKIRAMRDPALVWHLIGPLQSNKCSEVAIEFDWLQSLDREKLIEPLARARPAGKAPLNVLIQVNIDTEASKSGCAPEQILPLAARISGYPSLRLRGLMAIPSPQPLVEDRARSFVQMRQHFLALQAQYSGVDTLSMGMSDDYALAIQHGATMVRVGSGIFGAR